MIDIKDITVGISRTKEGQLFIVVFGEIPEYKTFDTIEQACAYFSRRVTGLLLTEYGKLIELEING